MREKEIKENTKISPGDERVDETRVEASLIGGIVCVRSQQILRLGLRRFSFLCLAESRAKTGSTSGSMSVAIVTLGNSERREKFQRKLRPRATTMSKATIYIYIREKNDYTSFACRINVYTQFNQLFRNYCN